MLQDTKQTAFMLPGRKVHIPFGGAGGESMLSRVIGISLLPIHVQFYRDGCEDGALTEMPVFTACCALIR